MHGERSDFWSDPAMRKSGKLSLARAEPRDTALRRAAK